MIKILGDRVLVRPIRKDMLSGGVIILYRRGETKHLKYCRRAEVIAVGPGKRTKKGEIIPIDLSPGNIVFYEKMLDSEEEIFEIKIDGKECMILETKQILGIERI